MDEQHEAFEDVLIAYFDFHFSVQHDAENDTWRATEADNFVVWGYGETAYSAIADLCQQLDEMEDADGN